MLAAFACMVMSTVGCKEDNVEEPAPAPKPLVAIDLERVDETEIDISLSAHDADAMAYYIVEAESVAPDAATIFSEGESAEASQTAVTFTIVDLTPDTAYTVFAAASKDDVFSDVVSIDVTTAEHVVHDLISDVNVSGLSVSYNIDLGDNYACFHTYIEKWFYDYEMFVAMQVAGPEFDKGNFIRNMVADYGVECNASGIFEWTAGEEHPTRHTVSLTPGKEYYVIAAAIVDDWWADEEPSAVPFKMPEPNGMSSEDIVLSVTDLTCETVTIRMECDETKVAFFFYDLYRKAQFDEYKAEKGEYGMMDFLFEYNDGNVSANTYTDKRAVDAGESYMFAVYGIDYNGCEIYKELQIDVPGYDPSLVLDVVPYERELQGYHDYDTLKMTFEPQHFSGELNFDNIYCSMMPTEKATFDAYLEMMGMGGMSLEALEQAFSQNPAILLQLSYMLYIYPIYSDEAAVGSLQKEGYFERIFSDLNADTEYVVVAMAVDGETPVVRVVSARTAARPAQEEASEGYKAYLGNWTVKGKTTADWTTYETYDLRVEELTPNRSFKVYGWSHSSLGEDFPFVMRYHPETGKVSIDGPQVLGTTTLNDKEMEIQFFGKMYVSGYDDLVVFLGYNGPLYTGSVSGNHLSMFSEMVSVEGRTKEFMSMNYLLRDGDDYYKVEDDGYDLVYFSIDRPETASASSLAGVSPLRRSANRATTLKYSAFDQSPVMPAVKAPAAAASTSSHVNARLQSVAKVK